MTPRAIYSKDLKLVWLGLTATDADAWKDYLGTASRLQRQIAEARGFRLVGVQVCPL